MPRLATSGDERERNLKHSTRPQLRDVCSSHLSFSLAPSPAGERVKQKEHRNLQ